MHRRRYRLLAFALVLTAAAGCPSRNLELTGKGCPCVPGWVCDERTNSCVRTEDLQGQDPASAADDAATMPDAAAADPDPAPPGDPWGADGGWGWPQPPDATADDAAVHDAGVADAAPKDTGAGPCQASDPVDGNPCNTRDANAVCSQVPDEPEFACECSPGFRGALCEARSSAGNGADGHVTLRAVANLALDNTGNRQCADGGDMVFYTVTARMPDSVLALDRAPGAGCLNAGDEVLVMKLLGRGSIDHAGAHEVRRVAAVDGPHVALDRPLQRDYGRISSTAPGDWVILQRIPNYGRFTVPATATVVVPPADIVSRTATGVFALRGELVTVAGAVDARGAGLPGGRRTLTPNTTGESGASPAGQGTAGGAGGVGEGQQDGCPGHGAGGGGAGHAEPGEQGSASCAGDGGPAFGDPLFSQLFLGPGGGAGGTDDNHLNDPPGGRGGAGGGVVVISAQTLTVGGSIDASGAPGEGDVTRPDEDCNTVDECWDYAGPGGGGAGGSILLSADSLSVGAQSVTATGGAGGLGLEEDAGDGGDGAAGRIVLHHGGTFEGTTTPSASIVLFDCESVMPPGPGPVVLDPDGFAGEAPQTTTCTPDN